MTSRSRCVICKGTTANKKQKLHLVTINGEDKLQFGYYSYYKKYSNESLLNTEVHEKCYKKIYPIWYKAYVETKANNQFCSKTSLPYSSIILEQKSPLGGISNIDYSSYSIDRNRLRIPSPMITIDASIHDTDTENRDKNCNSLCEINTDLQYHDASFENKTVVKVLFFIESLLSRHIWNDQAVFPFEEYHIDCDSDAVQDRDQHPMTAATG